VLLQNPEAVAVLRKLADCANNGSLEDRFAQCDPQGTGMIKKGDFVNGVFESTRGAIQASELMGFMNVFTTSFDEVINYGDFLGLIAKVNNGG
jgi:Ca2+-binding EF-hand superfamily protein